MNVLKSFTEFCRCKFPNVTQDEFIDEFKRSMREEQKVLMFQGMFEKGWLFTGKYDIELLEAIGPVPWLFTSDKRKFVSAINAARGARFEFGECGVA